MYLLLYIGELKNLKRQFNILLRFQYRKNKPSRNFKNITGKFSNNFETHPQAGQSAMAKVYNIRTLHCQPYSNSLKLQHYCVLSFTSLVYLRFSLSQICSRRSSWILLARGLKRNLEHLEVKGSMILKDTDFSFYITS